MVIYIQMMSVHKIKLEVGNNFFSIIIILATLGLVLCRQKFSGLWSFTGLSSPIEVNPGKPVMCVVRNPRFSI